MNLKGILTMIEEKKNINSFRIKLFQNGIEIDHRKSIDELKLASYQF